MDCGLFETDAVINPGGSAIVDPRANIVAGPVYAEEAIITAEIDTDASLEDKRMFDVVGHYGRPDVFSLTMRGEPVPLQLEEPPQFEGLSDIVWTVPGTQPTNRT